MFKLGLIHKQQTVETKVQSRRIIRKRLSIKIRKKHLQSIHGFVWWKITT